MYKMMDVGMVILQFGGNVVPYMKNNYSAYERYFKRELNVIKKILPGIPVIVIGPSDMSIKEKDMFITYPNLEGVRDAIRKATLDSGFVFWDMYEAMGGKNSMPSWVTANPPLAAKDYVHFNARGAKIVAEMFSNALLNEYSYWLIKTNSAN
jgi:lysophospholipase L1-like esterase